MVPFSKHPMFIEFETSPTGKKVLVNLDSVKWIESNDPAFSDLVFEVREGSPVSLPVRGSIDEISKRLSRFQGAKTTRPEPPSSSIGEFSIG